MTLVAERCACEGLDFFCGLVSPNESAAIVYVIRKNNKVQAELAKTLLDFKSIPRHKRTKTFMEISGYSHYENVCSNILKFYLDPTNEHGLKGLVLNSLLHLIDKGFQFDIDFEQIKVFREYRTINDNRLDLVVLTENYAIGIENKIFHHLHNDLTDYRNTVKSLCRNSEKPACIVLSLNKLTSDEDLEKVDANDFVNITYEQFFQNVKRNIGEHLDSSNISYIIHLTDFMKSIENLTSKTMENRELWTFFKKNLETIQDLVESFGEYKKFIAQKINQLNDFIPKEEFAPLADKQWVYKESFLLVLVHDYTLNAKYKLAIDTTIDANGWQIQLFGRDIHSSGFIFNELCNEKDFLPQFFERYEEGGKLTYKWFNNDTDISSVVSTLTNLLTKIEDYKKRTDNNNNTD